MSGKQKLKKELFGQVGKLKVAGGHQVNEADLLLPLPPGKVTHVFCNLCGFTGPIDYELAQVYGHILDVKLPEYENLKEHYFEVSGCGLCDGEDKKPVALYPLPQIH